MKAYAADTIDGSATKVKTTNTIFPDRLA